MLYTEKVISENLSIMDLIHTYDFINKVCSVVPQDNEVLDDMEEVQANLLCTINKCRADNRTCPKCGGQLYYTDVEGYEYVCPDCNENFYGYEAVVDDYYTVTVGFEGHPNYCISQVGEKLSEIPLRRDFIGELHEYFIRNNRGVGEYDLHITIEKNGEYIDSDNCRVKFDGESTVVVEVY